MEAKNILLYAIALVIKDTSAGYSDPSQALAICAAPESDSILVAHEDCSKFYKCFQGRPVAIDCPPYLLYNPDREYCDYPENVNNGNCQQDHKEYSDNDYGRARLGNSDPSQAPAICAAQGSDSILVAHEDCGKFYICAAGRPIPMNCPRGLFFNPDRDLCDYTWNVNNAHCKSSLTETFAVKIGKSNSDPGQAPSICAAPGSDSILVAHEDCSKFYKCFQGRPVAIDCPPYLLYNPDREYCDYPENVNNPNCQRSFREDRVTVRQGHDDPSQAPAICSESGSNGVLIAHEDCSKFYICAGGRPIVKDCPVDLFFNPEHNYCDWSTNNVNCQRSLSATFEVNFAIGKGRSDPSQAPAICAASGSDNILVAHEDCSKFYKCFQGKPVAIDCPPYLLYNYNPDLEYCDWPQNVICLKTDLEKSM